MITIEQLKAIMPLAPADTWIGPLNAAMTEFNINTPARQAMFLANVAQESGQLRYVVENMNYSAVGLLATFPRYFQNQATADAYARQPERIANRAYANRLGNGQEASGDGWKYRARSPIGITGRANYYACSAALGLSLISHPEQLEDPVNGARASAWFWSITGLNRFADAGDFDGVCDAVNIGHKTQKIGDAAGYTGRLAFYNIAKGVLNA